MYRFLPIIAAAKGFRSREVPCEHMQERGKTGLYGISLYLERIIDILTLYFNTRFARKPLRFFGNIGALFLECRRIIVLFVFLQKVFWGSRSAAGRYYFSLSF